MFQVLSVQPSNDPIEFGSPVWSGDKTNVLPAFSNLESSRKIVSVPMSDPKDDAEEGQLYEVELTAKNADSSKRAPFIIRMGPNAQTLANADFVEGNGFGGFYKLVIKVRKPALFICFVLLVLYLYLCISRRWQRCNWRLPTSNCKVHRWKRIPSIL